MNTLDTIYSRRTIRNFNGKAISEQELSEILKSAYAAPVGRAMYDSLSITVVTNKDLLLKWEQYMANAVGNPDMHPFYGAPTVILVSSVGDGNVNYSNAAILVQNMALAATDMGIGACHIWGAVGALNGNAELVKELKVPDGMTPCCAIALGYFDGKYEIHDIPENRIRTEYVK